MLGSKASCGGTKTLGPEEASPEREAEAEPSNPLTVVFSSVEIGASTSVSTGFKRALGLSLDEEGFIIMGTTGASRRNERTVESWGISKVSHLSSEASLLLGYQWKTESAVVAVFVGPEMDHRRKIVDGHMPRVERPTFGGRLLAEVWAHPSDTTLATGTLLVGTAPLRLWARHQYGWRVWDSFYVGPEVVLSLEEDSGEARLGLHVTGFEIGGYTFNISGGLLLREDREPGGYAALTLHFKL